MYTQVCTRQIAAVDMNVVPMRQHGRSQDVTKLRPKERTLGR